MLLQVYSDPVLKRNQKLYHSFVRDVKSRGVLSATLSPQVFFFCASPVERCA